MNPAVILPYRPNDNSRRRNYETVSAYWETLGWPVYVADSTDPARFDKAEAVNTAIRDAASADVFVIADVDILHTSTSQVTRAAERAYTEDAYVTTYTDLLILDERTTETVCAAWPEQPPRSKLRLLDRLRNIWLCSFAISRGLFERAGRFDERFKGYGGQDFGFFWAASTFGGKGHSGGVAYHLHHPFVDKEHPLRGANNELFNRYGAANQDAAAMDALIAEHAVAV